MINQGKNVPDKTIAVFSNVISSPFSEERFNSIVKPNSKKREWFTPHFYRCLPLTIGNQYGFSIASEHDFEFWWDGGDALDSIKMKYQDNYFSDELQPEIDSHFGNGILTMNLPFSFRTPPGINLMTINPPNYVLPNITVMTGVIESDNLRRDFTFNLKIQMPNVRIQITKGTLLASFIPIPRYFADSFSLKRAEDIFDEETVVEELNATNDSYLNRTEVEKHLPHQVGKLYFKGKDVYGNEFPDHQKP